jgi:hypothetical protein
MLLIHLQFSPIIDIELTIGLMVTSLSSFIPVLLSSEGRLYLCVWVV